jgi:hypothetical protein
MEASLEEGEAIIGHRFLSGERATRPAMRDYLDFGSHRTATWSGGIRLQQAVKWEEVGYELLLWE